MNKLEWFEASAEVISDNLEDFYDKFYPNSTMVQAGRSARLNPCPVCGHNDSCTIGLALNCFSCRWSGTHISSWQDYAVSNLRMSEEESLKAIADFTGISLPSFSKEELESRKKNQRNQKLLRTAENFYHDQMKTDRTYEYDGKRMTPLDYLLTVRKRQKSTIDDMMIGFVLNFPKLREQLLAAEFTDQEIHNSGVKLIEGMFAFFYKDPISKEITRINTKNPFNVKYRSFDENNKEVFGEVIKGHSIGDKSLLFSPAFTFKQPYAIVEGEHDLASLIENGCPNACCIGGNIKPETFDILESTKDKIYSMFDNDEQGKKYVDIINQKLPHKDIYQVNYDDTYKDPDEYFRDKADPKSWEQLTTKDSEQLQTSDIHIHHKDNVWYAENRFRKLQYIVRGRNDKGAMTGQASLFIDGELVDREDNINLEKCKVRMKPINFFLNDAINSHFNTGFDDKSIRELMDLYWLSSNKSTIIASVAKILKEKEGPEVDKLIVEIKGQIQDHPERENVIDAILKEYNDLQQRSMKRFLSMQKIKVSQYFNIRNNDGYFYFTYIKHDGDATRKLPYLLRNDKTLIRLDLIKKKDKQCMLLVDNKYELPIEVKEALFTVEDCSLVQDVVERYVKGEIQPSEYTPVVLVKQIESYLKRFYYAADPDVYKILALYAFTTYFYELLGQMPYLHLSGEAGSGKSQLDAALYMFCFNAKLSVEMTEAVMFRVASTDGGTIILDELENMTSRQKNAESTKASILKGGYARNNPVYRFNVESGVVEKFDTFGPKIISNIFGVDDVISQRCIPIDTKKMMVTKATRLEDPKNYIVENMDEIKEITSKCCIAALENFQKLHQIFNTCLFETSTARLTQILNPLLAVAKLIDLPEVERMMLESPEKDPESLSGEFEKSLYSYYLSTIKRKKEEIDKATPEGIIRRILPRVALELVGGIAAHEIEYINASEHKYTEPILHNLKEGWFEINLIHFKCFIEENMPGETAYTRIIPKWLHSVKVITEMTRRTVRIENEDLTREFKGNTRPKVNSYKFYFKDYLEDGFLSGKPRTRTDAGQDDDKPKKHPVDKTFDSI